MKLTNIVLLCLLSCCFQIAGTGLIKFVLNQSPINTVKDYLPFLFQVKVILALIFVFIAALIMFKALSFGSLSLVTPIFTTKNFIFTVMVGRYFFNENISFVKITGLVIILVGVLLVANSEN